ncbi:MAG: TetR family transcriptional regulator, partial [Gemmatimonadales bacterium]|nr:TetR family transcriptional regulator [Gemmatimonadales bacterium]
PHPPLQARSERTLAALAAAAEALLADRDWSDIGIQELCRQAGCTTGAFYARFHAKDDLLPFVYARYDAALAPRIERLLAQAVRGPGGLRPFVRRVVSRIVRDYRERRWLLRAVGLYSRAHSAALSPDLLARRRALHDSALQAFLLFRDEITHRDPARAVRTGLFIAAAAARDKILFDAPHAAVTPLSDAELVTELTRALHAYLTG